jgi:hypothetical protein
MLQRKMVLGPLRPSQCAPPMRDKNTKLPEDISQIGSFRPQVWEGDGQSHKYRALRVLYFNYTMKKV